MSDYGQWQYITQRDGLESFASYAARQELEEAADLLAQCGYADDAAQETLTLLLKARQWHMYASAIEQRLAPVWGALHMYNDTQKDNDWLKKALAQYRGEQQ